MELACTSDLKSDDRKITRVRIPPAAINNFKGIVMKNLKAEIVSKTYCVALTKKEMRALLRHDETHGHSVCYALECLDGVKLVDYEAMFGPYIWLTVDCEHDNQKTWDEIFKIIKEAIKPY